jgi:hypothetical protein
MVGNENSATADHHLHYVCGCGSKCDVGIRRDLAAGNSFKHCDMDVSHDLPGSIIGALEERNGEWVIVTNY